VGTKNSTSTATQTLPGYVTDAYQNTISRAQETASRPFVQYEGGFTGDQSAAYQNIGNMAGVGNQQFSSAGAALDQSLTPTSQTVGSYMSPYTMQVVDALRANQQESNAIAQQGVVGNAAKLGALGGNRVAVAQSELARKQKLGDDQAIAQVLQEGYGTALGAAQADKTAAMQAAGQYGSLGQTQMETGLAQAGAQLGAGTQQQDFLRSLYQAEQSFPYAQDSWLASIAGGLGPSSGGTTTETRPDGNTFASMLGLGLQAASLFSDERVKEDVRPVGKTFDGQTIYSYRYKGEPATQVGLLAQEVQGTHPEAVSENRGVLMVDYDRATRGAARKGEFATGGVVPYGGPSTPYGAGIMPYPTESGYIPGVQINAAGGNFPRISAQPETENPLDNPTAQMTKGADNIKSWFSSAGKPMDIGFGPGRAYGGVAPRMAAGGIPYEFPDDIFAPRRREPVFPTIIDGVAIPRLSDTGAVIDAGIAPRASAVPANNNVLPRSERNRNPGNIVVSPWTEKQPGFSGSDGRFAIFDTPENGQAAMHGLLGSYINRGFDTVPEIINRWAPPSDNNPTQNYARYVSEKAGVAPDMTVTPDMIPGIARAMGEFESGNRGPVAQGGTGLGVFDPTKVGGVPGVLPAAVTQGQQFTTAPTEGFSRNAGEAIQSLFSGEGLNVSPDIQHALFAAGSGMMASKRPNALSAIGEGSLAGQKAWNDRQALERDNALARANIATQANTATRLGEQMWTEASRAAADIGKTGVETQAARFVRTPTAAGLLVFDVMNPDQPPKIIPYSEVTAEDWAGVDAGASPQEVQPTGVFLTEPPKVAADPRLMNPNPAVQGQPIEEAKKALDTLSVEARGAQASQQQLQEMQHNLETLPESGWLTPGAGFENRVQWARGINTATQAVGLPSLIPEEEVAAGEDLNKLTTRLGQELNRGFGSDNAASIVQASIGAVPGGANSKEGAQRIIAGLEAMNQRKVDLYNWTQQWASKNAGSTAGAEAAFNSANPPELYAMSAYVPEDAILHLRKNPDLAEAFNQKYGGGKDVARFVLRK